MNVNTKWLTKFFFFFKEKRKLTKSIFFFRKKNDFDKNRREKKAKNILKQKSAKLCIILWVWYMSTFFLITIRKTIFFGVCIQFRQWFPIYYTVLSHFLWHPGPGSHPLRKFNCFVDVSKYFMAKKIIYYERNEEKKFLQQKKINSINKLQWRKE